MRRGRQRPASSPSGRSTRSISSRAFHHDAVRLRPDLCRGRRSNYRLDAVAGTAPRVWGCKRPELLITETLAFHDRRTQDTNQEVVDPSRAPSGPYYTSANGQPPPSPPTTYDPSFDQTDRPQGSLFIELFNPSSLTEPHSGDLYTDLNGDLDLTRLSINTSGLKSPVWRLIIVRTPFFVSGSTTELKDPDDPVAANQPTIERAVYFANITGLNVPADGQIHYYPASAGTVTVAPGGYALIGPGETSAAYQTGNPKRTYIGFRTDGNGAGNITTRYIDLNPTWVQTLSPRLPVQNNSNSPADPTSATTVNMPAMLAIDSPHRLSVSEPIQGPSVSDYDTMETQGGITGQGAKAGGAGVDTNGKYTQIYDIPFDIKRTDLDAGAFGANSTVPMFRVIYLQRLADPLVPYDPINNPYRTVDAMPVDLTVFNGLTNLIDPQLKPGLATYFEARQRGENNYPPGSFNVSGGLNPDMNLWKQEPVSKTAWSPALPTIPNHYFTNGLKHSLGYLNQEFGPPVDGTTGGYKGGPSSPFPWLTSNGRPYVSPLELLLVPTCSSSKLLVNAGVTPGDTNYNKYFNILRPTDSPQPYTVSALFGTGVPYPHLMNFFQSAPSTPAGSSPQFHRSLEYLGVPSPFVATEIWANPAMATAPSLPPFDRITTAQNREGST